MSGPSDKESEQSSFASAAARAGIKPLTANKGRVPRPPKPLPTNLLKVANTQRLARFEFVLQGGDRPAGRRVDQPEHAVERLSVSWAGERLDLHGYRAAAAEQAVIEFVRRSPAGVVLIIVGKGRRERPSALRSSLPHWLTEPPNAHRVAAFCCAPKGHGGVGAVLVALI